MPIYEYECRKCRHKFEMRRHFGENAGALCPSCQGEAHRVFMPVPIIFKGSGFYVNDYPSKSRKEGKKTEKEGTEKGQSAKAEEKRAEKKAKAD